MLRQAFIICMLLPLLSLSQSNDCDNPIPLEMGEVFTADSISGPGNVVEMEGNSLGSKHFFTEEHNTLWYRFKSPDVGKLTLLLTPDHLTDDWDFLLYENLPNACKLIKEKSLLPIRGNLARNKLDIGGITGISEKATNEFEVAGPNSNFSKILSVEKDKEYLIFTDNNTTSGHGHDIVVQFIPNRLDKVVAKKSDSPILKEVEWVNEKPKAPLVKYSFEVLDEKTKKAINCSIKVVIEKGFGQDSVIESLDKSKLEIEVKPSMNFSVNVSKQGYMFLSTNYRSPKSDSAFNFTYYLPEAKAGELISLPDINFRENTTHLLTNSINALQQIYDFMINHPKAKIEIRGHVNAPGYENSGKVKRFSEKRAEEVKAFLVGMGLDGSRMKTLGMGNGFMIYPNPLDYEQEKANRRVEIKILEN